MSDINQDDIDKLLQEAMMGGGPGDAAPPPPADKAAPAPAPEPEDRGPASQDDIDALFASVGAEPASPAPAAPAPAPAAPAPAPAAPAEAADAGQDGAANQDDIDALFSAVGGGSIPEAAPAAPDEDLAGVANQDDIDALFSNVAGPSPAMSSTDTETVDSFAPSADASSLEERLAEAEKAADSAAGNDDAADLDALLSSIAGEGAAVSAEPAAPAAEKGATEPVDDFDMDALLKQINDAAPPPPPPRPAPPSPPEGADTAIIDFGDAGISSIIAGRAKAAPPPASAPAAPPPPAPPPPAPMAAPAAPPPVPGRREYSVLYGAGEVESVAGQISALISSMSEKAHGYMQAWIAADSEAKELRSRALAEERRRTSLESEKAALSRQIDELRTRLGEAEGSKIAGDESRRTLETSFQARLRELESRVAMLTSEADTLKEELTRARNQATGVDIESRRARFEVDRLKNEVESERMERLRIQRALENREKEIQAVQAQSSGQASSLFIDELHRLVRRLESELEGRTSGAHEALKQLDRLQVAESMVPVAANLRAALMQALGADDDADDALKSLGREAAGVRGPAAVAPAKSDVISFETALSTFNLSGAIDVAGALLRDARATPGLLMRKIYQCPALRRPEIADHLSDLARLLEGLRTVQESSDRSRGSESGESEVFYIHMFDFLHNLVRLKLVTRLTGDMWRVFLDLRGRFSFVTSDKQWAEYRDKTLGDHA